MFLLTSLHFSDPTVWYCLGFITPFLPWISRSWILLPAAAVISKRPSRDAKIFFRKDAHNNQIVWPEVLNTSSSFEFNIKNYWCCSNSINFSPEQRSLIDIRQPLRYRRSDKLKSWLTPRKFLRATLAPVPAIPLVPCQSIEGNRHDGDVRTPYQRTMRKNMDIELTTKPMTETSPTMPRRWTGQNAAPSAAKGASRSG